MADTILSEASLSFLGLGIDPSIPSWGQMLSDGRNYLQTQWWIAFLPGFEEKERQRIHKFYGHNRPLYRITPGIQYFLGNRTVARDKAYRDFLKIWRKWREQETWLSLRETILLSVPAQSAANDSESGNHLGDDLQETVVP
jgi:hypothetical protein